VAGWAAVSAPPFNGRVRDIRSFSGARLVAVSHAPDSTIGSHQHDWPHLGFHLAGGCVEQFDGATAYLDRPGAIYHPAASGHSDQVLPHGLETVGLIFDPAWIPNLSRHGLDRPCAWRGGRAGMMARRLLASWTRSDQSEAQLQHATGQFFAAVAGAEVAATPAWLECVLSAIESGKGAAAREIAASLDLHPAWLARRYRQVTGEGVRETVRRKRVERALVELRASDMPLAEVALQAGFCDQPHMNRCFRAVLGRSPQAYRLEAAPDRTAAVQRRR
jgi:AraC family transcriptional regulator